MRIAVAGGTGLIGAMVVELARHRGHDVVVMARSTGIDLTNGVGVEEALVGVEVVIDTSNVRTASRKRSVAFFETAGRTLLAAGERAGVRHHLALSIVGVDRVDLGYYAGKLRQEELVERSALPSTVLRATQFHEFAAQLLLTRGPLVPVPVMRSQPVSAAEVAEQLLALAVDGVPGRTVEMAGPEVALMPQLVRQLAHRRRRRTFVVPLPVPGAAGRAMRSGGLLPATDGPRGITTFADWLRSDASVR